MKSHINILTICILTIFAGCYSDSDIIVELWGKSISTQDLITFGDKKIIEMDLEQLYESKHSDDNIDKDSSIYFQSHKIKRCYNLIRKITFEHYMEKYSISVDNEYLMFWINKFIDDINFNKESLLETKKRALFDLELIKQYLKDKGKAKDKFNQSTFAQIEGVWDGIEKRAEIEDIETVNEQIRTINQKGIAYYLFSDQVGYICRLEKLMNIFNPNKKKDYTLVTWEAYKNIQLNKYRECLVKEIKEGNNIRFYDNKMKRDVLEYIERQ